MKRITVTKSPFFCDYDLEPEACPPWTYLEDAFLDWAWEVFQEARQDAPHWTLEAAVEHIRGLGYELEVVELESFAVQLGFAEESGKQLRVWATSYEEACQTALAAEQAGDYDEDLVEELRDSKRLDGTETPWYVHAVSRHEFDPWADKQAQQNVPHRFTDGGMLHGQADPAKTESALCWRRVMRAGDFPCPGDNPDALRLIMPAADPAEYEQPMDLLFTTPESAVEALKDYGYLELAREEGWKLCRVTVTILDEQPTLPIEDEEVV
jgi:hypothetical protein